MITAIWVVVFCILFVFLIILIVRKQPNALSTPQLVTAFLYKVALGCLYGYLFGTYYGGDDTWAIHIESIKEWQLLQNDPLQFFWEYTPGTAMRNGNGFLQVAAFYIADLEYCLLTKTLGIFNLISRGNYYINVVFFNFIVFWGHYWLYLLAVKHFRRNKILVLFCTFFLPTAVFWLSGIRGDGMLFFFFSLLLLSFDRWLESGKVSQAMLSLAGFAGVMIFRIPVAVLLLPALISWAFVVRGRKYTPIAFAAVYGIGILLFFASSLFMDQNGPAVVAQRQELFLELKGNTRYELPQLEPGISGFVKVLPYAFFNTFLRPHPWEAKGMLQLAAAGGILLFWGVLTYFLFARKTETSTLQPLGWVLLLFGISLYLLIGYTVPFPGAIVRYKSIGEMVILVALLGNLSPRSNAIRRY